MCEPISMIMMGLSAAATVAGGVMSAKMSKPQAPPKAEAPRAIDAPVQRNQAAVVRLGTGKMDETGTGDDSATPMYQSGYGTRRISGNTLGNLGKSSLI